MILKKIHKIALYATLSLAIVFSGCSSSKLLPATEVSTLTSSPNQNDPGIMFSAFKQGPVGNCATISVIKTLLVKFGFEKTFISIKAKDLGYNIELHGGISISIKQKDIDMLKKMAQIIPGNQEFFTEKARFLYAVIAYQKFKSDPIKYKSLQDAVEAINGREGQSSEDILCLLGYEAEDIALTQTGSEQNFVINSKYHSAFASEGYYDEYGEKIRIAEFKQKHRSWWQFWKNYNVSYAYRALR